MNDHHSLHAANAPIIPALILAGQNFVRTLCAQSWSRLPSPERICAVSFRLTP